MPVDWDIWLVVTALIAFNIPIGVTVWHFRKLTGLAEILGDDSDSDAADTTEQQPPSALAGILREKTPEGRPTGALSYSRVTGLIGAVIVASLFWIMSNVAIGVCVFPPGALCSFSTA